MNENNFKSGDLVEVINESPYKGVRLYVYKVHDCFCELVFRNRFHYGYDEEEDDIQSRMYNVSSIGFKNKELKLIKRNK